LNSKKIDISYPNGDTEKHMPAHAIVSLHDMSFFNNRIIGSDAYAKMLKWKKTLVD